MAKWTLRSMSSNNIISRAARLLVTPVPTTLSDSLCILKHLQTFGHVSSFLNPRYVPALPQSTEGPDKSTGPDTTATTILAIFASPECLDSAVSAASLTVQTGLDNPNPRNEDPYNVRGLRDRAPVARKTFHCQILPDHDVETRHGVLISRNPKHCSFPIDKSAPLFASLAQAGAPIDALASIGHTSHLTFAPSPADKESNHYTASPAVAQIRYSILSRKPPHFAQSLVAMYNDVLAWRAEGHARVEDDYERRRAEAKRKRQERNRRRREEWREYKERKLTWIKERQVKLREDIIEQVFEGEKKRDTISRQKVEGGGERDGHR